MQGDCCFCVELSGASTRFSRLYPELLHRRATETARFVLVPSLGQLTVGHMLLVPRRHVTSFGELCSSDRAEASELCETIARNIANHFGPPIIFEHGSPVGATAGGCGIVHAHIHFVPFLGATAPPPPSVGSGWIAGSEEHWVDDAAKIVSVDNGYLAWHAPASDPLIEAAGTAPSQYLRQHAAQLLGTRHWDWRDAQREPGIVPSLLAFRAFEHSRAAAQ